MKMSCFAWEGDMKEDDGIRWIENERCFALNSKKCEGCRFYKHRDSVRKHTFILLGEEIVEWLPK